MSLTNQHRQLAAIRRMINNSATSEIDTAEVISVPTHGQFVMIRRGGSKTFERAYIENKVALSPGERVAIIRPDRGQNWVVLMSYSDRRSGQAPNVPRTSQELAAPSNLVGEGGVGCMVIVWETPPVRPDLSYQIEVADDPDDLNTTTTYYTRGSLFVDLALAGVEHAYRVRCINSDWDVSGWTDWIYVTALAGITVDVLSARPILAVGMFYATDTGELFIGDGVDWRMITGGGGGLNWDVDLAPASPSAYDDEFNDSSFDTGLWTEYDVNTEQTISESGDGVNLSQPTNANIHLTGIFQAIPAGDFTIACKVKVNQLVFTGPSYVQAGIILWDDASNSAEDAVMVGLGRQYNGTDIINGFGPTYFSDWDSATVYFFNGECAIDTWYYLRVRRTGSTLYWDYSEDGLAWTSQVMYVGPGTPSHFGVGLYNKSSDTFAADFDFFRYRDVYDASSDPLYGQADASAFSHSQLLGLDADDHTQYHNDTRGDARYSQLSHTHEIADVTDFDPRGQALFYFYGTVETGPSALRIYNAMGVSKTISKVFVYGDSATGLVVDIHKNGTTIFTTQSNRPTLSGDTGESTTIEVPTWAAGEYLTCEIDTAAGANVVVHVVYE